MSGSLRSHDPERAAMRVCFQHRRVRHNENYVPYGQMPVCPLCSISLESL